MTIKANFPAIKPSLNLDFANSKVLDPRITFIRGSTATYYDGKTVAKAEENLLTYSQDFDSWGTPYGNCSVTSNSTTAPDGTLTADLLVPSAASSSYKVRASNNLISTTQESRFSVYVKSSGYSFLSFVVTNNTGRITVDFVNNTYTAYSGSLTATSTAWTNGWYRVVITIPSTISNSVIWIGPNSAMLDPSTAVASDGTSGIYLWGAQLEQRSQATAYTPTTSAPITNYIPALQTAAANVARFDHDPVTGESKGMLIEEQRTNLLTYSSDFDNAAWPKTNITLTPNATTAPDGTLTADLFAATTNTSAYYYRSVSLANGTYTYSIFVKKFGADGIFNFYLNDATGSQATVSLTFTGGVLSLSSVLTTNVFSAGSATATNIGNGWYRVALTATITNGTGPAVALTCGNTGRDGYSGIYIWGVQLEAGAFPTSYIPTTSAQVTRSADSASITGTNFSSWYRADEGTLVASYEVRGLSASAQYYAASLNAAYGSVNVIGINAQTTASQHRGLVLDSAGAIAVNAYQTSSSSVTTAFAVKTNDFAFSSNGATPVADTVGNLPSVSCLSIGTPSTVTTVGGAGTIKRIAYYPKRLSNTQLQSLTS